MVPVLVLRSYTYAGVHVHMSGFQWMSHEKKATEEKMKISYHSSLSSYGKKAGMYQVSRKSKASISIWISNTYICSNVMKNWLICIYKVAQ